MSIGIGIGNSIPGNANIVASSGSRGFTFEIDVNANDVITLPLVSSSSYDFVSEWGDGSSDTITAFNSPNATHTYTDAGTYTVVCVGSMPAITFKSATTVLKNALKSVISYGEEDVLTLLNFSGCVNLTSLPDETAKLRNVTTFREFLRGTGIVGIPVGTLAENTTASDFYLFAESCTSLAGLDVDIFKDNINMSNITIAFNNCPSTSGNLGDIFRNCPNISSLSRTFQGTRFNTVDSNFGQFNTITNFYRAFFGNLGATGDAPALWLRFPSATNTTQAFAGGTWANNDDIPIAWK